MRMTYADPCPCPVEAGKAAAEKARIDFGAVVHARPFDPLWWRLQLALSDARCYTLGNLCRGDPDMAEKMAEVDAAVLDIARSRRPRRAR